MELVNCQNMRRIVMVAALLLAAGILLLVGSPVLPEKLSLYVLYTAFPLLISSPLVMLIGLVLSLLPGSADKLEHCIH